MANRHIVSSRAQLLLILSGCRTQGKDLVKSPGRNTTGPGSKYHAVPFSVTIDGTIRFLDFQIRLTDGQGEVDETAGVYTTVLWDKYRCCKPGI